MEQAARRKPWVGIVIAVLIVLAIVAFGLFKRKGARKPPPIPEDQSSSAVTNPTRGYV